MEFSQDETQTSVGGLSTQQIAVRLFFTCWLIFSLHFSSNIVREIYLALAIGDHLSFKVDEYANMHPDLFEKEGFGWHIGSNPGVSMLAAIPYVMARPVTDFLVQRVRTSREASGASPPAYNTPWPMAKKFFEDSWNRGLDIKFGLAALIMQVFCMAPSSALGAVLMFLVLRTVFPSEKIALWLAILYAFGTPVFFRTGYLNHNLMLGHIAFLGFVAIWNPFQCRTWSVPVRYFLGGLAGGTAILFDYSGVIFLLGIFSYAMVKSFSQVSIREAIGEGLWYVLGTLAPVFLLWFYQWQSFGHPFFPGQHWMPPVEWIDRGYQGFSLPQWDLFLLLGFDYRYGLFVTSPLLLLAFWAPLANRTGVGRLPWVELSFILTLFLGLWVFFSCVNYTRLQFNTGLRYMAPILPFLFLPTVVALGRLPSFWVLVIGVLSISQSWALAMYRDVERGLGMLDPILQIFWGGFKLPILTTLSRMEGQFGDIFSNGYSPLPLFLLTAALLYILWTARCRPLLDKS